MPNYQKGKIYKITCNETNQVFVGCTIQNSVAHGVAHEVNQYNRFNMQQRRSKRFSYPIIERGNYTGILLHKFPCNSRDELVACESEWIHKYRNDDDCECLNREKETRQEKRRKTYLKNKEKHQQILREEGYLV